MQSNGQASGFSFGTSNSFGASTTPTFQYMPPSQSNGQVQPSSASSTTPLFQLTTSPQKSKSIIQPATFSIPSSGQNQSLSALISTTSENLPPATETTSQEPIANGGSSTESFVFQGTTASNLNLCPGRRKGYKRLLKSRGKSVGHDHPTWVVMSRWQTHKKKVQPDNVLGQQYEYKIRPCIDLIDSLRSLGVEKDLGLPAIAVIGDQSSGKSSVLEALSGVNLPRGSGIVTRCPLVLKLKKSKKNSPWKGKISYLEQEVVVKSPGEVEKEVRKAQDHIAGAGNGVSEELITLEVESPNVPDLTLLDLPGITRVALPNQPPDIGQQIKNMITKYIKKQETINLAVVPSNMDIATTEALEMARAVDPKGERTLGILTKPDLVDKGSEQDVVSVVRNLVYPLKKGYMIVKCRGQMEIYSKTSLETALQNEKAFFKNHEHFGVLMEEGRATISLLAEKLTVELVDHISRTIPNLEGQIKQKLHEAQKRVKIIGAGIPETESDKLLFLIDRIRHFVEGITQVTQGEEEATAKKLKLFTNIRKKFCKWEMALKQSADKFPREIRADITLYENQHRGRELTGFVNYKTFENIARNQIQTFEEPAIDKLNEITELIRSTFNNTALKHFTQYPNLYRSAKGKLEEICSKQQKEAEKGIRTQFKMEQIIYCQDTIYGGSLKEIREEGLSPAFPGFGKVALPIESATQIQLSVQEMSQHIQAYFKNTTTRLSNQIPLIVLHYMLHEFADKLQAQMLLLLQEKDSLNVLLVEKDDLSKERKSLREQIKRLREAQQTLAKFPC
ncbi:interferon-induced GTP-binding protein Mx2-like isoform X2 [Bufo gargarizans]|uniref:interferon-induced GTP-binding protein Mx2-like isoform X2 n=1 Tax=Bufo gargarizans TaxID=30331 RepID=UPI001CF370C2|nr:interferon-induced GTP-binding protein Mx2-like isoform X2 [Bufo gargarizans]